MNKLIGRWNKYLYDSVIIIIKTLELLSFMWKQFNFHKKQLHDRSLSWKCKSRSDNEEISRVMQNP